MRKKFKIAVCLMALLLVSISFAGVCNAGYTYALHTKGLVNVIDESTGTVVASINTDVNGNGSIVNTGGTLGALTPNGKKLYVSNAGAGMNTVTIIDAQTLTKITDIVIGPGDIRPKHGIVSPNGKWLGVNQWRRNPNGTLRVSFINTKTDTVHQNIDLALTNPNSGTNQSMHSAWSWNSKYFFTSSYDDDKVFVFKAPHDKDGQFTLVATYDLSISGQNNNPHYMAPSNDGLSMWIVTEGPSGSFYNPATPTVAPLLYIVNLETLNISGPLNTLLTTGEVIEGHHGSFSLDGKYFYFCNRGPGSNLKGISVDVINANTREIVAHVETAPLNTPEGDGHPYISPDGKTVAITKYGTNVLTFLDQSNNWAQTNLVVGTGIHIGHITFTPKGETAFVMNRVDGAVYQIDGVGTAPYVSKQIPILLPDLLTPAGAGTGQVLNTYTNYFEIPGKIDDGVFEQ